MTQQTAIQTTNNNSIQVSSPVPAQDNNNGWSYVPQLDVLESTDEFTIVCDAPGLNSNEINLTFDNGVLHVDGRVTQRYTPNTRFLRQEYGVGDYYRQITLGRLAEFVDGDRIRAEYTSGVLTVHLPKLEAARPRKIEVKAR